MTNHSPVPYSLRRHRPLNTELLERVRQIILMRPELHDQMTWGRTPEDMPASKIAALAEAGSFCGTTACVAGWAAIFAAPKGAFLSKAEVRIDGTCVPVSTYAAGQLGLTWDQRFWLFTAGATREQVLWTLKWLPDHPDADMDDLSQAWYEECLSRGTGH